MQRIMGNVKNWLNSAVNGGWPMQKTALLPWEIHSSLTEDRLTVIGRLVWAARKSAARDAKWHEGDCLWDIGCKAYVRTRYSIAMGSQDIDWLSLASSSPHDGFMFRIGGVPIRFYRGDPEATPPGKYAHARPVELLNLQAAFALSDTPTPDACFRLVVRTDPKGFPLSVTLVQVNTVGEIQNPWRIPVDLRTSVRHIARTREEPVELPPPPVGDEIAARKDRNDPREANTVA